MLSTAAIVVLAIRAPDTDPERLRPRIAAHLEALRDAGPASPDPAAETALDRCLATVARGVDRTRDPGEELEAGLWALARFLDARDRLAAQPLAAPLLEGLESEAQRAARHRAAEGVTFLGRQDLGVHFFAAAALCVRMGPRAAARLALAKELADAEALERGEGTGFSFADLCAGEAGIRFASHLVELGARWPESFPWKVVDFMPTVAGLEEGLTAGALDQEFGGTQGPRFQSRLRRIRERIAACEGYRD